MERRQFVQRTVTIGVISISGCIADLASSGTDGDSKEKQDECKNATVAGPGTLYDSLTLYQVPDYVEAYSESVVIQYDDLGNSAKDAVQQALATDAAYKECIRGKEQTTIKAFATHIEQRWEEIGREAFQHTYLHYEGGYYGINLVQEGDFIRVDSIPCTQEECPTTPTPPS